MTQPALAAQRREALDKANTRRVALAAVKRDLRTGTLTLEAAMHAPPPQLRAALLIDVIRWARAYGGGGDRKALGVIGARALDAGVNLMLPVGGASPQARAWVAEHGSYFWRPSL